jgi:hypothetical protein
MLKRITLSALLAASLSAPAAAQQDPQAAPPGKQASAGAEPAKPADAANADAAKPDAEPAAPQEVKVLRPADVPAEKLRIKSKADIKCEVTLVPAHGREVVVKGVVRNGKLIERFAGRVFVEDPTIEHQQCGVRLWWVDNTAGWIFLRYSQIRSIALTGVLTAEEKQQIMERLKAAEKQKEEEKKAQEAAKLEEDLLKMSTLELEAYLLREYPAEKGWNHEKLREVKKKQLIDNQPLTREESVFVSYFPILIKARLKDLKREKDKVEFEPGSADKPAGGARPGPGGEPAGDKPAAGGDEPADPGDEPAGDGE